MIFMFIVGTPRIESFIVLGSIASVVGRHDCQCLVSKWAQLGEEVDRLAGRAARMVRAPRALSQRPNDRSVADDHALP
jgi:hypothetical protein